MVAESGIEKARSIMVAKDAHLTEAAFEALLRKASQPIEKPSQEPQREGGGTSAQQSGVGCSGTSIRPNRTEGN